MSCTVLTDKDKELLRDLPNETEETLKGLIGIWMEDNPNRKTDHPTLQEIKDTINRLRGTKSEDMGIDKVEEALTPEKSSTIEYTPKGKTRQTYTIRGNKIFNKQGKEVFKKDTADRLKIFANLAVRQGRAVVVSYKDTFYIVNNKGQIISGTTGKIMQWREENGDRKAVLELANAKFSAKRATTSPSSSEQDRGFTPSLRGRMSFSYGDQRAEGVTSRTTLEAIKKGERTATTRYTSDGNIGYWSRAKVGDVVEFSDGNGEKVLVRVTKELHQLPKDISAEEWSAKEGWDISRFEQRVKPKIEKGEAYQMEFEYIDTTESDIDSYMDSLTSALMAYPQGEQEEIVDDSTFEATKASTVVEQKAVDLAFDPQTRRDRISLITRLFSNKIEEALKAKKKDLDRKIMEEDLSEDERQQLVDELYRLDRIEIIRQFTPKGIFDMVRETFERYVNDSEEGRVTAEFNKINGTKGAEKYSTEQKMEAARKKAEHKTQEYQKIIDNFKVLAEEASRYFLFTENIVIDPRHKAPRNRDLSKDDNENSDSFGENSDAIDKEESYKDGWMTNFREVSSFDSLSKATRRVLRELPRLDYKGKYSRDDLGNVRYLDPEFTHAVLIDKLKDMITPEDMIPLLEDLAKTKPWVKKVIKLLNEDDILFSQFYQDFRKDFTPYWIQKKVRNPDGTFRIETVSINRPEGIGYLLDSWRDNYESGTVLDEDSIYDTAGNINKDNAKKGLEEVERLNDRFNALDSQEERLKLLEEQEVIDSISRLLSMIGVNPNSYVLKTSLTNIPQIEGGTMTDPVLLLLPQLHTIFKGIIKGDMDSQVSEENKEERKDLINEFNGVYTEIANLLKDITEDAIESSTRENDKAYYSHANPSYLGKLIKKLRNVIGGEERFQKFLQDEYKQYDWFYDSKEGRWRHDWLQKLDSDPSMRKLLDWKVLLNHDKKESVDWDEIDDMVILLNEYMSDPKRKTAWYYIPQMSDAPSAEFIKFIRYTNGSELNKDGTPKTFQDILVDKFIDIINQEYNRIQVVRERGERFLRGEDISPIANFDIRYDNEGNVIEAGGSEFKFLPALNNLMIDGKKFVDRLAELKNGSPSEFRSFLDRAVREIMNKGFEETYKEWFDMGLFSELDNGMCRYIPFEGLSRNNKRVANSLNQAKNILGEMFTSEMERLLKDYTNNKFIDDNIAQNVFSAIDSMLEAKVSQGELKDSVRNSIMRNLTTKNNIKDFLREYYWNSKFATSQIIQLTTTDLAYYKNIEDFQKRYKEIHAPSLRLNTMATFHGKPVGRIWERTLYLTDNEIVANIAKDVEEIFLEKVKSGEMSEYDAASIIAKFGNSNEVIKGKKYYRLGKVLVKTERVNVADAQAYRSLSSYRAIMAMSGQWTDEMETAYEHLQNGQWSLQDFNTIWQPKKPFVYTQIGKDSGLEGHSQMKVPIQHKNSEFPLLAIYQSIAGPLGKSDKLRAINDFMEKYEVDVIQFESTTKVGKQGLVDINNLNSYNDIMSHLEKVTGLSSGNENPNVVHKIPYEDYGIQTATPEHGIDHVQLIGTQIRKLIAADLPNDIKIKIGDKEMTKKEWIDLYNAINTENIISSFKEVNALFKDKEEVEKAILDEIYGNPRYSIDMVQACTLDENGNFNIPLHDPVISGMVQQLLNSLIKKTITKQRIKGGALIQVSDYGLVDDLHIVFEGKGKNKRIKYIECYMPAYSKKFYEPLMDKDGTLDIEKLPSELRELIGYRVPTESKYSMTPLRIKGFLPQQNGSAIMLPAEITTLSGSDFDIDKLYIMLPESDVKKNYNIKGAWDDFYKDPKNEDIVDEIDKTVREGFGDFLERYPDSEYDIEDYMQYLKENGVKRYQLSETAQKRFSEWFSARREWYATGGVTISKIKYDYSKSPQEQSVQARNNALIDMMWSILTNPVIAPQVLKPGGFDKQKKADRVVTILDAMTEGDLQKEGITLKELVSLPLDRLTDIASRFKVKLDPLSPITQVKLHQMNITGGKMVGIYANHNANHALMQYTSLEVNNNGAFTLMEETRTSLHSIKNDKGEVISDNTVNYLAASVDNVKDNTLYSTNQNTFTGDASMLLSRLGYNPTEIAILMRQPIIMEITKTYFRESREGKSRDAIIKEIIRKTARYAGMSSDISWKDVQYNKFKMETLMKDIILYKSINQMGDILQKDFYRRQVAVGLLFSRILHTADALKQVVNATRADTSNGAAGPTIADTMDKIFKVWDLLDNASKNNFQLSGVDFVNIGLSEGYDSNNPESEERLRQGFLSNPIAYVQAFFTLGVEATIDMLSPYFPQMSSPFIGVLAELKDISKTERLDVKTMNNIYNELIAFILTKTEFFGKTENESSEKKRNDFINKFPSYFQRIVSSNPELSKNGFISRLHVVRANRKSPVDVIAFRNVGRLTPILKERFTRDWASLLYSNDEKVRQLAMNLFLYSFYRNGLSFGPSTFAHLAPSVIRYVVPGYIDTLRSMITNQDSLSNFVSQYIYNHLDNKKFVPEVPSSSQVKFTDSEGKPLDTVAFTIGLNPNTGDMAAIKKEVYDSDGNVEYEFCRFISRRENKKTLYYELSNEYTEEGDPIYVRIEPLGYKNNFLEYDYYSTAHEMKSVIDKNSKDYDPLEALAAQITDNNFLDEGPTYMEGAIDSYIADSYRAVLGENPPGSSSTDDTVQYTPNTEYRDANNDNVCGATLVATFK